MFNSDDIIFAVSSTQQRAALHLQRLSGCGLFSKLSICIRDRYGNALDLAALALQANPLTRYVRFYDLAGVLVDDVVITLFRAPCSYTGEDVVEISSHGNPLILSLIQSEFRKIGFRDAQAGEFTYRAVLNGKQDLAQAEALLCLLQAESRTALGLARASCEGAVSRETNVIRKQIVMILALLEAHIDFDEDEVGTWDTAGLAVELRDLQGRLSLLAESYRSGLKWKDGLRVVLCGSPNAGKSTLFNAVLKTSRAIVTPVPGTTRDTLEERLLIRGRDFVLIDTAGLRETTDVVEQAGIERTWQGIASADIICVLVDLSQFREGDFANNFKAEIRRCLPTEGEKKKTILVISKDDCHTCEELAHAKSLCTPFNFDFCFSVNRDSFVALEDALVQIFDEGAAQELPVASPILVSVRQRDNVMEAAKAVEEALCMLGESPHPELVSFHMQHCRDYLDELIGVVDTEQVLDVVFSQFCIGK